MSPELETLDQLLGGDLPVPAVRSLFADSARFVNAVLAMLKAGEIVLLDADGQSIPEWGWSRMLTSATGTNRIQITDRGAKRIA